MSNYFSQYCSLIGSTEQLAYCQQASSLGDLLLCIRQLWSCTQLSDDELLGEISRLNQTPIAISDFRIAGMWLPYRYQPKRKLVNWLIPVGHATEPFQDEYISRCRQKLFNQIIQPCSSLEFAQQQAGFLLDTQPAGFIFHLSRCGSTLISGCLSELESTSVFSESPLLTELLLDNNLSFDEQRVLLKSFINLQSAAFPGCPHMVIKWNAWDIFRWELIRDLYPQVPTIFLVRDPVEILASHHRLPGWHMSGDLRLASVHPIFNQRTDTQSLLYWRCGVLRALLEEMSKFVLFPFVRSVQYRCLDADVIEEIVRYFSLTNGTDHLPLVKQRLKFNSKMPQAIFSNDSHEKQTLFSNEDKSAIQQQLMSLYAQFLISVA